MKQLRLSLLLGLWWGLLGCADKNDANPDQESITIPATGISRLETTQDLDPLLNQLGPARYALLGEATHGTAEFYNWRAALSKRLIQEKGFTLIAVEGDWPALYELNRYVKGNSTASSATEVLRGLKRWPTWLWANQEVARLAEWLRQYNSTQPPARQVSFYGLDVYSLWESLEAIRTDFTEADQATRDAVRAAQNCLGPYADNEEAYGEATLRGVNCGPAVQAVLTAVRNRMKTLPAGHEGAFNAEQNALVAVNAEQYYRVAVRSSPSSWNVRDTHMMETINRLMNFHGPDSKLIVWEHNTHVGDARYTDMAQRGEINVGQLTRQQHASEGVYIVGTGTYHGTVVASPFWGGATTMMTIPPARVGSWEEALHEQQPGNKLILLAGWRTDEKLTRRRGHRAIGVVYNPGQESGNYVPSDLPNRYDAFLFIDQTQALHPLGTLGGRTGVTEPGRAGQLPKAANF